MKKALKKSDKENLKKKSTKRGDKDDTNTIQAQNTEIFGTDRKDSE